MRKINSRIKNTNSHYRKNFYLIGYLIYIPLIIFTLIYKLTLIADIIVSISFFTLLYFLDRKYQFSNITVIIATTALILGASGSLGMYSYFVIYYFGFDKLTHFTNSFAAAFIVMHILKEKNSYQKYLFVILIVLGIGAVHEINEFVGFHYLHIKNFGIFTQGDNLAEIKSDLQVYDTYFDMIFNFFGASLGVLTFALYNRRALKSSWLSRTS